MFFEVVCLNSNPNIGLLKNYVFIVKSSILIVCIIEKRLISKTIFYNPVLSLPRV